MSAIVSDRGGYDYSDGSLNASHVYLMPAILRILQDLIPSDAEKRIFELGCGNGSVSNELTKRGFEMTGVDPSPDGLRHAKEHYPHGCLNTMLSRAQF